MTFVAMLFGARVLRNPITGIAACCARTGSGQFESPRERQLNQALSAIFPPPKFVRPKTNLKGWDVGHMVKRLARTFDRGRAAWQRPEAPFALQSCRVGDCVFGCHVPSRGPYILNV